MYLNSQYIQHGMDKKNFTYTFVTSICASITEIALSLSFIDVNATYFLLHVFYASRTFWTRPTSKFNQNYFEIAANP
jgi:hypothetical protein